MRIELKEPGQPTDVNVTLKNKADVVKCKDPIFTVINNRTFDLHCTDLDLLIDSLDINVFNQKRLCTVEVSGGRNVALHQSTDQTGSYGFGKPEKAVDGRRNSAWKDESCTHTDVTYPAIASWRVDFDKPFYVNRYVLYNRNVNKERLQKFKLSSYSSGGSKVFEYNDTDITNHDTYSVASKEINLVSSVNISNTPISINNIEESILTLCEVEIFGDSYCQEARQYGLDCNKTCNCFNQSENCLVSTGGCPSGCAVGYTGEGCNTSCDSGTYGKDCYFSCNFHCLNGVCDFKTGHCIEGCTDGYAAAFCNETCSLGTYGQNCSETCSANCINKTCSPFNGSCDCKPGFQGNTCEQECNPGSYGNHCNQNCSANCDNNCSTVDGSCKCKPGFQGNHCNRDCDLGYYGDQCSLQCSANCINTSCNNINGSCSCVPGYSGDKCDQAAKINMDYNIKKIIKLYIYQIECSEHTYGDNCLENCNLTCLNSVCNNINGRCKNGCIPGKEGDFCQFDCQSGKYGKNCKEDCSVTCGGNGLCHQVFGNCSEGCQDGFKGDMCSEALSADEDQSNDAAVAIPIVLVLLIIVAILLGVIFWRRRNAKKAAHAQEGNLQKLTNVAAEDNQLARIEVEADSKVNNDVEYYNTALEIADTPVPVDKIPNYLRTHNKAFFKEQFLKIPTSTNSPTQIGSLAENKLKNRYKNILPYDHCRVHLSVNTEKKHGDYINASFVKSYRKNEKFIASQGPNKVILEDFVRMLWEQKVDKVVMLTNLVEEAKQKCEQYWPKEGDEEIGQFRLRLINTEVFADCGYITKQK
uniref:Tyrosine-protein phosphatase domain-containing protein n=1 Tax=Biomphalaria glabrata TaxID=6526 RepID=A0A2C9L1S5_BIOGL